MINKAAAEFKVITCEVAAASSTPGANGVLSIQQTMSFQSRVWKWYHELPAALSPYNIVVPVHLELQ